MASHSGLLPEKEQLTFEQAVDKVGFGRFQYKLLFLASACWTVDAMEILMISYISPAARCEWDLTTTEESLITTVLFFGMLLGAWFWGLLSDHYGRRLGFISSNFLLLFGALVSAYSGTYWILLISRVTVGFALPGSTLTMALLVEYLSSKYRVQIILLLQMFWAVGCIIEGFLGWITLSYFGLDWRWLPAVTAIPVLFMCVISLYSPESSRYYLARQDYSRAQALVTRLARENSYEGPEIVLMLEEETEKEESFTMKKIGVFRTLFSRALWRTTLLLWIIWFVAAATYYGVILYASLLEHLHDIRCHSDSEFVNQTLATRDAVLPQCIEVSELHYAGSIISAIGDLPGTVMTYFFIEYFGRRWGMSVLYLAGGFFTILLLPWCSSSWSLTFFLFVVRSFAAASFNSLLVYTPEVFPTSVRTSGMGSSSSFSRFGGMMTSFLVGRMQMPNGELTVLGIYSGMMAFASVCCLLLPYETKGVPLKNSVEEIEMEILQKKDNLELETGSANRELVRK
eukprot:TRINITY_DN18469_c0_g1_i1.p1 TRINITY_DN18469_c0_g1~~TRINITY_DN18469_c0_g1_i1.p1  ORF type:complete len:514 (-),score=83.61 TRINITY_DN18469_c0_g1_i1:8-1549(-)